MKIILFGVLEEERPWMEEWSAEHGIPLECCAEQLSMENVDRVKGFDGVCLSQVVTLEEGVYEKLESYGIRQLAQRSAGVDMYDLEKARRHRIIITNVPSYSPESIAEFAVMNALRLLRKSPVLSRRVDRRDFRWMPEIRGEVLGRKTVLIVGLGRIGSQAAKMFHGFGCRVLAYDIDQTLEFPSYVEPVSSIEEGMALGDVISLHIPGNEMNEKFISRELLSLARKGSILINAARGSVIDTEALVDALESGHFQGAAIDVYDHEEPYVMKDFSGKPLNDGVLEKLLEMDNVIYTPHVAFYTDEAVKNLAQGGLSAALEVMETGDSRVRVN